MTKIGSALLAAFVVGSVAFLGWWVYDITRPLPASGVVTNRHVALVKGSLVHTLCVRPAAGKAVCRLVNAVTYKRCAPGAAWPACGSRV